MPELSTHLTTLPPLKGLYHVLETFQLDIPNEVAVSMYPDISVPEVNPLQDKVNKERLKKREEALKMLEIKKNRYTPEEYEQKIKDIDNKYPINEKKAK